MVRGPLLNCLGGLWGPSDCSQGNPEPVSHPSCPSWTDSTIFKAKKSGGPYVCCPSLPEVLRGVPPGPAHQEQAAWEAPSCGSAQGPCALCCLGSSQNGLFLPQGHSVPTAPEAPPRVPSALCFLGPARAGPPPAQGTGFIAELLNSFPERHAPSGSSLRGDLGGGRPRKGPGPAVRSDWTRPKPPSAESCR